MSFSVCDSAEQYGGSSLNSVLRKSEHRDLIIRECFTILLDLSAVEKHLKLGDEIIQF